MSSRPMSYDSLCKIIQHLEANKRIEMALRIPSIRSAEKSVPLKIDDLSFDERSFTINDTEYEFGLYRHYETRKIPEMIQTENNSGGSNNDVDVHGFEKNNWNRPLPGDFVIKLVDIDEPPHHDINTTSQKEIEIGIQERYLYNITAEYKKLQACGNTFVRLGCSNTRQEINSCKLELEKLRYQLQCYYCLRDNTPAPFKPYIQLTKFSAMNYRYRSFLQPDMKRIERVEYKTTLPVAMKAVLKVIFGNRKHPVQVSSLRMTDRHIVRAPTDLKLKIRELDIVGSLNRVWNSVNSIIHSSSLPLKELSVDKFYVTPPNLELEVAKTAKKLVLKNERARLDWIPFLLSLENMIVEDKRSKLSVTEYIQLITSWVLNRKQAETMFSFHVKKEEIVKALIEEIIEEGFGTVKDDGRVVIPMRGRTELQVSYQKHDGDQNEEWILEFEIVGSIDGVRHDVAESINKLRIQ